jgi:hypothetical protein
MTMNTNDELAKARAELASAQERLAKIEAKAKERTVAAKQWEPQGGRFFLGHSGEVVAGETIEPDRLAGTEYPTRETAESALPYVTFFKRLCCLAAELNPSGKVGGIHYVFTSTHGRWITNDTGGTTRDFWCLFETEEAAQKAADIMNRDGWKVPSI